MNRLWRVLAVCAAGALVVGVSVAFAGVPHLSKAPTASLSTSTTTTLARTASSARPSGPPTSFAIVVGISATGVSNGDQFKVQADSSSTYGCVNGGSSVPSDIKKVDGPTAGVLGSITGDFRNGKVNATFTSKSVQAADPASILSCPSGQTPTLIAFDFTNITVTPIDGSTGKEGAAVATNPSSLHWQADGIILN